MLEIDPSLVLSVFVTFLFSIYLFNKSIFQPLLSFMENRKLAISKDLVHTKQNISDAEKIIEEAESIIKQAKMEASKEKEALLEKSRKEFANKVEQKKNGLEQDFLKKINQIKIEKETLISQVQSKSSIYLSLVNEKIKNI